MSNLPSVRRLSIIIGVGLTIFVIALWVALEHYATTYDPGMGQNKAEQMHEEEKAMWGDEED